MRLIKRIFGILVVLVIALVAIAFILPREVAVSRSVEIAAPPAAVFPHVNSLQKFSEWSPWSSIDPDMQVTYTGPEMGVGNKMEWILDSIGRSLEMFAWANLDVYIVSYRTSRPEVVTFVQHQNQG